MDLNPASLGFNSSRLSRINAFMQAYVDNNRSAGIVTLVARHGEIAYLDKYGYQDTQSKTPISYDTIFRIYSMTKPITSVAIMMMVEQGQLRLLDPIEAYIPAFGETKVLDGRGGLMAPHRPITVRDLLTHTAGLSYGDFEDLTKYPMFEGTDIVGNRDLDLEAWTNKVAGLPLLTQPGTEWHYSLSTDILGRLIEVISGQRLGDFFRDAIFAPLGMSDTFFDVPPVKMARLATLYGDIHGQPMQDLGPLLTPTPTKAVRHAGGGGLYATITDYYRFAELVRRKGELDGIRLLGRKSVDLMTANHMPASLLPIVLGEPMPGIGFGLGFRRVLDATATGYYCSKGSHGWGGWANTVFWVDPEEDLIGILMNQYITSNPYPIREDFYASVYQALG